MKHSIILTDELPTAKNKEEKKSNIPNFVELFKIKCFQLKEKINEIIN